jgi:hypothetical protein
MSTSEHVYLSTSCHHGKHERCADREAYDTDGDPFRKLPAQCKICSAPCICPCHATEETP